MYLWIFRLIFFSNPFPDRVPCTFPEAEKGGKSLRSAPLCNQLTFPRLIRLLSIPPLHLFSSFWGFSLGGLRSFLRPNPCIHLCKVDREMGKQLGLGWAFCHSLCNGLEVISLFCTWGLPVTGGQQGEPQHQRGAAIILPQLAQPGLAPAKSEGSRLVRQEMLLQGFYGDRSGRWETTNKRPTKTAPG